MFKDSKFAFNAIFSVLTIFILPLLCHSAKKPVVRDGTATKSCCWPTEFTSLMGRHAGLPVGGAPGIMEEEMMFEFDLTHARWGFWNREKYYFHEYTEMIYTEELGEVRKATIANFQGCVRTPIMRVQQMHRPCIPDWAEFLETSYISDGVNKIWFDTWTWKFNSTQNNEKTTITVTGSYLHDNCRPMSEVAWWTAQEFDYTAYISFLDMKLGKGSEERSAFKQLDLYYECEDQQSKSDSIDATPDAFFDAIYLKHRIHTANYIIVLPESKPIEEEPKFG